MDTKFDLPLDSLEDLAEFVTLNTSGAISEKYSGSKSFYVGKSKNLNRRFNDHVDPSEPNPKLYGLANKATHEFWWLPFEDFQVKDLDEVEKFYIQELKPDGNKIGKGGKKGKVMNGLRPCFEGQASTQRLETA